MKSLTVSSYFTWFLSYFSSIEPNYYVIILVAFSQGIVALSDLALNYLYKDDLKLIPAQVTQLNTLAILPWIFKPVYGLISDSFPIFGYRRKPYLFTFGLISIICWLMMSFYVSSYLGVMTFILFNHTSNAFCCVIGEALIVEISHRQSKDDKEAAAKNVSLFYITKSFGSLLTAISSGTLLVYIHKRKVFLITSLFPFLIVLSSFLLTEESFLSHSHKNKKENEEQIPFQDNAAVDSTQSNQNDYNAIPKENNEMPILENQLALFWSFLQKPEIYRPVIFIFLFMMPPNYSDCLFFFYTNRLMFSPVLMGRLKLIYGLSSVFGIYLYNSVLKSISFKKILYGSTLLSMIFNLFTLIVVLRLNQLLGISDFFFCIGTDALANALGEINVLPILVLACNICPKNIEGTIYAFLVSIVNIGILFSNQSGSILSYFMTITEKDFEMLHWLIIISNVCYLVPLPFLYLIDENAYNTLTVYEDENKPLLK